MTPWEIKAAEFANGNRADGCPCQFNALPANGNCESVAALEIHEGHYGDGKCPRTGNERRTRTDLPHGFEYAIAEVGRGTDKTPGKIAFDLENSDGHFARLHLDNHGVVRHRAA